MSPTPPSSVPFVVVRHGKAEKRSTWEGDDEVRPLTPLGEAQAAALTDRLAVLGLRRVVSSPSVRCADTVRPFCVATGIELELDHRLSEPSFAAKPGKTRKRIDRLASLPVGLLVCTHRPVLPSVFRRLLQPSGVKVPKALAPGEFVVVLRQVDDDGHVGHVLEVERHPADPTE